MNRPCPSHRVYPGVDKKASCRSAQEVRLKLDRDFNAAKLLFHQKPYMPPPQIGKLNPVVKTTCMHSATYDRISTRRFLSGMKGIP